MRGASIVLTLLLAAGLAGCVSQEGPQEIREPAAPDASEGDAAGGADEPQAPQDESSSAPAPPPVEGITAPKPVVKECRLSGPISMAPIVGRGTDASCSFGQTSESTVQGTVVPGLYGAAGFRDLA